MNGILHKISGIILILGLSIPFNGMASNCQPASADQISDYLSGQPNSTDPCEFYRCLNKELGCKADDYLIQFGLKYCQKLSLNSYKDMSKKGKTWFRETMECLQVEIDQIVLNNSSMGLCKSLKKKAVATHLDCYKNTHFCSQKKSDRQQIINEISIKDIITLKVSRQVFIRGFELIKDCRQHPSKSIATVDQ